MSTVDEVLATAEVVDAVCIIDGETRIISVPNEYKELGVESDEKVTRVKFQCPKIVGDNIDLTEYNLYINYRNAGNKLNSYLVEDVAITGDTINFSWLLSRHVTESPGTINYIVCAKKSDDTGVINEWNTKVATGTVGIGLEATEEIEEQNIDAIEQILRSIVELENKVSGGGSGEAGGYYAPAVDADGNLTWTASKADMPAVDGANIKGPKGDTGAKGETGSKGDKGDKGADGKSAYQYAVEGGYTGTEAEFAAKLAAEKLANPNALTFTGAVTGSYDGSAPLEVAIPSGGADCTIAVDMLASGTVAQGSEDPVDTGITLGKLKEYKMFIFSVSGVSNVNLHNWYTKIGDLSISRVNNVRGQTILYEFLNTEKTVMIARNGTNGNHSVYESYKASSTTYGVNNASYFPDGIYELSSISESTHVITYPIKSDTVDVKWTILGVVK